MAFPSATGSRVFDLPSTWSNIRSTASDIKGMSATVAGLAATGTTSDVILNYAQFLADGEQTLTMLGAVSGLAEFAQAQLNDQTLDIVNEFNGMVAAMDAAVVWIIANHPKDANGFVSEKKFNIDNSGRLTEQFFPAEILGGFISVVNAVIAAID